MPGPPQQLRVGDPPGVFDRRDDLYGIRTHDASTHEAEVARIPEDAANSVAIYRGRPAGRDTGTIPVYSAGGTGPLAVATGRVLVRFADSVRAEDRRTQLAEAGVLIERTLSYAPNAVWVVTADDDVTALERLDALASLRDVVHVEPQLLLQRATRR